MTDETMEKGHAMRVSDCIQCRHFACKGVRHDRNVVPGIILRPEEITVFMVSEAAPPNTNDYYYAKGNPSFQEATVQAFNEAGWQVSSMKDILARGVYVTTAVKCAKTGYTIRPDTVRECSSLLERELVLFPNVKVVLLMGDVAIRAFNQIARHIGQKPVIPAAPTYKIRKQEFFFGGRRVLPSYLQVGPSVGIEKGKRKIIAEDIALGLRLAAN